MLLRGGSRRGLGLRSTAPLACVLLAWATTLSCGKAFQSETTGSGGANTNASTGGGSVGGGASNAGGSGGSAGAGGTGGTDLCGGKCGDGQYCDPDGVCTQCDDFKRFHFGAPVRLATVSAGPGHSQTFPRVSLRGPEQGLFYTFSASSSADGLRMAFGAVSGPSFDQGQELPTPPETGMISEAALPLPLPVPADLLFDGVGGGSSRRQIMVATKTGSDWNPPVLLVGFGLQAASDNYHPAASFDGEEIARLWWIGGAGTGGLVTAEKQDASADDVPLKQSNGCHSITADVEPWVTADGTLLLFSAAPRAPTCDDAGDAPRRLFWAPLKDKGQPASDARRLDELSATNGGDHAPSLTADSCGIFFSSDREGNADLDIYFARRN